MNLWTVCIGRPWTDIFMQSTIGREGNLWSAWKPYYSLKWPVLKYLLLHDELLPQPKVIYVCQDIPLSYFFFSNASIYRTSQCSVGVPFHISIKRLKVVRLVFSSILVSKLRHILGRNKVKLGETWPTFKTLTFTSIASTAFNGIWLLLTHRSMGVFSWGRYSMVCIKFYLNVVSIQILFKSSTCFSPKC